MVVKKKNYFKKKDLSFLKPIKNHQNLTINFTEISNKTLCSITKSGYLLKKNIPLIFSKDTKKFSGNPFHITYHKNLSLVTIGESGLKGGSLKYNKEKLELGKTVITETDNNIVLNKITKPFIFENNDLTSTRTDENVIIQAFTNWRITQMDYLPDDLQNLAKFISEINEVMDKFDQNRENERKVFKKERRLEIDKMIISEYVFRNGELGEEISEKSLEMFKKLKGEVGESEIRNFQNNLDYTRKDQYFRTNIGLDGEPMIVIDNYKEYLEGGFFDENGIVDNFRLKLYNKNLEDIPSGRLELIFPDYDGLCYYYNNLNKKKKFNKAQKRKIDEDYKNYFDQIFEALQNTKIKIPEISFENKFKKLNFYHIRNEKYRKMIYKNLKANKSKKIRKIAKKFKKYKNKNVEEWVNNLRIIDLSSYIQGTFIDYAITIKRLNFDPLVELKNILENGTKIVHLDLSNLQLYNKKNIIDQSILQKNIKSILESILKSDKTLENLQKLSLPSGLRINDEILIFFCQVIKKAQLKHFSLKNCSICVRTKEFKSTFFHKKIAKFMRLNKHYKFTNNITNESINHLTDILENSSFLESVDLSYNNLNDEMGVKILTAILNNIKINGTSFKNINLGNNYIYKKSAKILKEIIIECSLLSLNIENTSIYAKSMVELSIAMRERKSLLKFKYLGSHFEIMENKTCCCGCIRIPCFYDYDFVLLSKTNKKTIENNLKENLDLEKVFRALVNVSIEMEYLHGQKKELIEEYLKDKTDENLKKKKKIENDKEFLLSLNRAKASRNDVHFNVNPHLNPQINSQPHQVQNGNNFQNLNGQNNFQNLNGQNNFQNLNGQNIQNLNAQNNFQNLNGLNNLQNQNGFNNLQNQNGFNNLQNQIGNINFQDPNLNNIFNTIQNLQNNLQNPNFNGNYPENL